MALETCRPISNRSLQPMLRARQRPVDVAALHAQVSVHVVAQLGMEDLRSVLECSLDVDEAGKRVVVHIDQGDGILGQVRVGRDDGGHRLSHPAHAVRGEDAHRQALHLDVDELGQLRREILACGLHECAHLAVQIRRRVNAHDPLRRPRDIQVDGDDPRVGERTPDDGDVQHVGEMHVAHVGGVPGEETRILPPADLGPDGARACQFRQLLEQRLHSRLIRSAASSTAFTMFT